MESDLCLGENKAYLNSTTYTKALTVRRGRDLRLKPEYITKLPVGTAVVHLVGGQEGIVCIRSNGGTYGKERTDSNWYDGINWTYCIRRDWTKWGFDELSDAVVITCVFCGYVLCRKNLIEAVRRSGKGLLFIPVYELVS